MPYDNPDQAQAVFLAIKKRQGLAAAKKWAAKHKGSMGGKAPDKKKKKHGRPMGYMIRSKRDA